LWQCRGGAAEKKPTTTDDNQERTVDRRVDKPRQNNLEIILNLEIPCSLVASTQLATVTCIMTSFILHRRDREKFERVERERDAR